MNKQLSSQALTSGLMQHRILYPKMSEISAEENSLGEVKWIGLHPLEMVDRIMSMTKHSSPRARSAANSIDAVSMISATTPPLTSKIDARCESLVDSILNKRNGATKEIAALPSSVKGKNGLFQSRMENWLIQNWTNPFPDTTALNVLATQLLQAQCIVLKGRDTQVLVGMSLEDRQCYMMKTAVKKIETYLTNTRLRKWRKSIEDAFDLRRPANLLFEDSLRLCQGMALRPIEGWSTDRLATHARYSLPLKSWKVKKKAAKKRSANNSLVAAKAEAGHVTPKRQRIASSKELSAGDGLIALAMGFRVMSTSCERKTSPSDVVVRVGGMGLSPFDTSPVLEDDTSNKMKEGTLGAFHM